MAPKKAVVCTCGHTFPADSIYCRKCGTKRPDLVGEDAPLMASLKRRMADAPPGEGSPKKSKVMPDIADKIENVARAMDTARERSEPCHHLLRNMTAVSLGTKASERNAYLKEAAVMIGRALMGTKRVLDGELAVLEGALRVAMDKAAKMQAKQQHALKLAKDAKEALASRVAALQRAEQTCAAKEEDKRQKDATVAEKKAALDEATKWKAYVDDLYAKHFIPVKDGKFADVPEANSHLTLMVPSLTSWGAEDCCVAAFEKAGVQQPGERGLFCRNSMEETEALFRKALAEANEKYSRAKDAYDKAVKVAEYAQIAVVEAHKDRAAAEERRQAAEKALEAAETELYKANKALDDANAEAAAAKEKADSKHAEIKDFVNGPMTDYNDLMRHETPGYDKSLLMRADGASDAVDSDDKNRVTTSRNELEDAESPDDLTRNMLKDMAPGCLGPKSGQRDDIQREAVEMFRRALEEKRRDLQKVIDGKFPPIGKTKFCPATELLETFKYGQKLSFDNADKLVKEKEEELAARSKTRSDVCGAPCERAKVLVDNAKLELSHATSEKTEFDDAFTKHFVPLRDGVPQDYCVCGNKDLSESMFCRKCGQPRAVAAADAENHITALTPIFARLKFEDCLMGAFPPAARHVPGERGSFCKQTMVEVERWFMAARKAAQDRLDSARAALSKAEAEAEHARRVCEQAKAAESLANNELEAAKSERVTVVELVRVTERMHLILS